MSEDCLTLNVWSQPGAHKTPVMVFIHGGGFTEGTASNPWYDGAMLAQKGGTVVTIQYRLGPFGWLDVSKLGAGYEQSMNNGLLDQISALIWVRENIAQFGGDPDNVTVFGESAGAISVSALLAAPQAQPLFKRAIIESGTPASVSTREWAAEVSNAFLHDAGVDSADKLNGLSTDDLLKAAERLYREQFADNAFNPVVGGAALPQLPARYLASSASPAKPVIIGTTLDEARYWYYEMPAIERLPFIYSEPWLKSLVGSREDEVVSAYKKDRPDLSGAELALAMVGDVNFRMPSIRLAEALSARGGDVYMYLATVKAIDLGGKMGSPHAVELPFVFGTTKQASTFVSDDAQNRRLADAVQSLWISFASGQQPTSGVLQWPKYETARRDTLMLDPNLRIESDPFPQIRKAWRGLRFDATDPDIHRATPLTYKGTNPYDPRVVAAMIGWKGGFIVVSILGIIALIISLGVSRIKRRSS